MNVLVLSTMFLIASQSAPVVESAPAAAVSDEKRAGDDVNNDDLEFVDGNDTPQDLPEEDLPPLEDDVIKDSTPPTIDDIAVAATNPDAAPFATGVFSDDNSGIQKAIIFVRAVGAEEYEAVSFDAGEGGMFLAMLPMGLQRSGFDYFVEVSDAAGNGPAQIGTEEKPYRIEAAGEGALAELKAGNIEKAPYVVHPAWSMLALGTGIVGLAVAGGLTGIVVGAVDVQGQWDTVLKRDDLTVEERTSAQASYDEATFAIVSNSTAAGIIGVLGTAAFVTGLSLLVVNGLE
ncbi:MAG: hypothetical protein GY822_08610 [Deltaproteobacteria bacterium]|nr:hypothetical protein [Deltaproteobacteria bacterium]